MWKWIVAQLESPAGQAFLSSTWYTLVGNASLFLVLMITDSGSSLPANLAWAKLHWWPFVLAQLIVPSLRAHAAKNLYSPVPEK